MTPLNMLDIRNRVEAALVKELDFKGDGAGVQLVNPPLADLSGIIDGQRYSVEIKSLDSVYTILPDNFRPEDLPKTNPYDPCDEHDPRRPTVAA